MKKILFFFLFVFTFLFTKNVYAYDFNTEVDKVYLGGETVGIKLNTGVSVVKTFGIVDGVEVIKPWENAKIVENDIIISYNHDTIITTDDLLNALKKYQDKEVSIEINRNGNVITSKIKPVVKDNSYTLGIYVKDNILGVGTLTYILPTTNIFGALGHKIENARDVGGTMYEATVTGIKKGEVGEAGSKKATIHKKDLGSIEKNTITGIHGIYSSSLNNKNLISIGKKESVHKGKAYIVTCLNQNTVKWYEIDITGVNKQKSKDVKGIKFKVTDETLLNTTNGIVQGMSGSPIIQDDKLVGAVTHVMINNPHEGYGIYIEFMLEDMEVFVQ